MNGSTATDGLSGSGSIAGCSFGCGGTPDSSPVSDPLVGRRSSRCRPAEDLSTTRLNSETGKLTGGRRGAAAASSATVPRPARSSEHVRSRSTSAFAALRSAVSKPSVNRSWIGASSSSASFVRPRSCHNWQRLVAARNSQDRALWRRAQSKACKNRSCAVSSQLCAPSNRTSSPLMRNNSAVHQCASVSSDRARASSIATKP